MKEDGTFQMCHQALAMKVLRNFCTTIYPDLRCCPPDFRAQAHLHKNRANSRCLGPPTWAPCTLTVPAPTCMGAVHSDGAGAHLHGRRAL